MRLTPHQAKYIAHELTLQHAGGGIDRLSQSLFNASVDLNPHQIDAAVFALRSPLSKGVLLADEVGLGKTIEAGIVLCQFWAERKRQLLVIGPASLRKQWALELQEKFNLAAKVLDAKTWREAKRQGLNPLKQSAVLIMSYAFAARMQDELRTVDWHLVVIDEAHKLRNAYQPGNKMGQAIREATKDCRKVLLSATPLHNSILELYGLSTLIDEQLFGDLQSFRSQFTGLGADQELLRQRLAKFCKRTLRKDVTEYVRYTQRKTHTQTFRSTDEEHQLYEAVSEYLSRNDTYAIEPQYRHLTELILRKLLASSSQAIAGTLEVMKKRLEALRDTRGQPESDLVSVLSEEEDMDEDLLDEILNESEELAPAPIDPERIDRKRLHKEIEELEKLIRWARGIGTDTKSKALLKALGVGFSEMETTGARRKALIFTESRRTQDYLKQFLESNGHAGKVVCFSGTNKSAQASQIYEKWTQTHAGTDRITGSRDVDIRAALVEHFQTEADILIATEAAGEGVNMQFCSLVINYDLPWNPQRVEQRIGRCHRYGQLHDVVVINFCNQRNHADKRVLELLEEKFKLFDGVFGASDEVLGRIDSGVNFERRILQIYKTCRTPAQIDSAFAELRKELDASIQARMEDTRRLLLENFDEEVHERLRLQLQDARSCLDKFSRRFWDLSNHVLREWAEFDQTNLHFDLPKPPQAGIPIGRYYLISRQKPQASNELQMVVEPEEGHTYRLSHPLGEWVIQQAKDAATPLRRLNFDPSQNPARSTLVENLKGQSGVLTLQKLIVDSFERQEYLLFSALTDEGRSLDPETCLKLMETWAIFSEEPSKPSPEIMQRLDAEAIRHKDGTIASSLETNNKYFQDARERLDQWADDKVLSVEQSLKNVKEQLKVANRESRMAITLEEQHACQEKINRLERQKKKQRQEIFDVEDEIDAKRKQLIQQLTKRMNQKVSVLPIFTIAWTVC